MKKALTIAGSDSGGGAGIQADLKTFMALGVYGASAITGITAQNTVGVQAVHMLDPLLVTMQINAVLDDIGADAVKTGMLGTSEIIEAVSDTMRRYRVSNLVIDPVMVAKSGDRLLAATATAALRKELLPLALIVTPNLPETSVLLDRPVERYEDMADAARALHDLGPRVVVVKGGHLPGDEVVDVIFADGVVTELRSPRIPTQHTHGTGCTYAAAMAALLALGHAPLDAIREARAYLVGAIEAAIPVGGGRSPVNHLYRGLPAVRE